MQPLILFGGTFDPPHNGHLLIANKLYDVFKSPITLLPTGKQLYKPMPMASTLQRLKMLQLIISHDKHFLLDQTECEQEGYCYSYKTLQLKRAELGQQHPIVFAIGSDSLISINSWDNWHELFELANFIIIQRPDFALSMMNKEVKQEFDKRYCKKVTHPFLNSGQVFMLDMPQVDISSTQIRKYIHNNVSITELVPKIICQYIIQHNLYI